MVEENLGIVIIGRNEGERLKACLASALNVSKRIVYVDSGSKDDSVSWARDQGVAVIELDPELPFSAGRARNEGFLSLQESPAAYVQFIDGDCVLEKKWCETALLFLQSKKDYAIACGRRRERYPEATIYNLLCDMEWDTAVGDAHACGGDFMVRAKAFAAADGFAPGVVAGEEPELCYRLREAGWKIARLDAPMTLHDAAITKFSQWWRRSVRSGHAYAQGYQLHGAKKERFCLRASLRIWFWAGFLPLIILLGLYLFGKIAGLLLFLYPALLLRMVLHKRSEGLSLRLSILYAVYNILGKFAELQGQVLFCWRLAKDQIRIVEYS